MRTESSYLTPVHGVSTLAPRNRLEGQAGVQVNFRSDPVRKLTRRPPLNWRGVLLANTEDPLFYHSYERDNVNYRYLVNKVTGEVHCYIENNLVETLQAPVDYVGDNMVAQTIDHETYFVNQDVVVELDPATDENSIQRVSHINITAALNYGEDVVINVTRSNGARVSLRYSVPDIGIDDPDYDTADQARSTEEVARALALGWTHRNEDGDIIGSGNGLNSFTGITARALGSTVAVWEDGRENWLDVEAESGQGDQSIATINNSIENIDGLPLYAVVGTRIQVRPNPTSDNGRYYLEAERTAEQPSGQSLEEVVWAENRSPIEPYRIDPTTTPFRINFSEGDFEIEVLPLKERQSGDDDTVPPPEFVGSTITNLSYFQKRLVFLSDNNVIMSEADDEENFWKQSAVQLLVNDTVSVSSSAVAIDRLAHAVPHDRDLLIIASNGQFKIDGSGAITPETVSMTLTTKYECQIDVEPVVMGNSVFYPIDYGESTGIHEYSGERNTGQDFAAPLTHSVVGYMQGRARLLTSSPNLEMLAMSTTEADTNKIFIYEQYTDLNGRRRNDYGIGQRSWSEWVLAGDGEIIDLEFRNNTLTVLVREGSSIILKELDMYARVNTSVDTVFLDDLLNLETDGLTVTLPENYNTDDLLVIRGEGTQYKLNKVGYTLEDRTLTFEEDISEGIVHVGKLSECRYRPTRPFRYDDKQIAITTDRIRISKFILSLVETNEIKMQTISPYYDIDDQEFNARITGELNNMVGVVPFHTGDAKFSFAHDADQAEAEFYCDNWLNCSIVGIAWAGQYLQTARRI